MGNSIQGRGSEIAGKTFDFSVFPVLLHPEGELDIVDFVAVGDSMGCCYSYLPFWEKADVINTESIGIFPVVKVWLFGRISIGIRLAPFDSAASCWKYTTVPLASCLGKAVCWLIFCIFEQPGLEL